MYLVVDLYNKLVEEYKESVTANGFEEGLFYICDKYGHAKLKIDDTTQEFTDFNSKQFKELDAIFNSKGIFDSSDLEDVRRIVMQISLDIEHNKYCCFEIDYFVDFNDDSQNMYPVYTYFVEEKEYEDMTTFLTHLQKDLEIFDFSI